MKGNEGEARGDCWFVGVASSVRLDRERERLTPGALERLSGAGEVPLVAGHHAERVVGVVESCRLREGQLEVRGRLHPEAAEVRERLAAGEILGLSLGGKILRAKWSWDREVEGPVRQIEEVELQHVAVCELGEAVNREVWVRTE